MAEVLSKPHKVETAVETRVELPAATRVETPVGKPTPPAPPGGGLPRGRLAALFAAPVILLVVGWGGATALHLGLRSDRPAAVAATADHPDGAKLFARHCANCHGATGDGNGIAQLDPKARYFGGEKFKLVTTTGEIPTDDDLLRVLRRGIPGTAMHAFDYLSEAEHRALIRFVRDRTRPGMFARFYKDKRAKLKQELGEEPTKEDLIPLTAEVARVVEEKCRPGDPLAMPKAFAAPTRQSIARGREVYTQSCAKCHGPDGHGDGEQVKDPKFRNDNGTPAKPRDLTRGVFKGGSDPEPLYARIRLGIPGTPMPATPASTVSEADVLDLINYVRSLSQLPGSFEAARPAVAAVVPGQ